MRDVSERVTERGGGMNNGRGRGGKSGNFGDFGHSGTRRGDAVVVNANRINSKTKTKFLPSFIVYFIHVYNYCLTALVKIDKSILSFM